MKVKKEKGDNMSLKTTIKIFCRRITENELETCINLLEDERKRRSLIRDDEVQVKKGN